MTKEI
jgi:hypothetical protein